MKRLFLCIAVYFPIFTFAQNHVGIGTSTPHTSALLHIDLGTSTTNGVLVTGTFIPNSVFPNLGAGTRLMFYPGKAAFRAGYTFFTWENTQVGDYSVAAGNSPMAKGEASVAMGSQSSATAFASVALGINTIAGGVASMAIGSATNANGGGSFASGENTTASGDYSFAIGRYTGAYGKYATAMGNYNTSKGFASTVIGCFNDSILTSNESVPTTTTPLFIVGNGDGEMTRSNALIVQKNGKVIIDPSLKNNGDLNSSALVFGEVTSGEGIASKRTAGGNRWGLDFYTNGLNRFTVTNAGRVGIGTTTPGFILDVAGRMRLRGISGDGNNTAGVWFNDINNTSAIGFLGIYDNSTIGLYGTGASWGLAMNLQNGNVGIGTTSPTEKLSVVGNICATGSIGACSDIRYKTNIIPMTGMLLSVLKIQPITYNWKKDFRGYTPQKQLGFSAQEIEQYFPEVVQTDAEGYKSVDYSRMTAVLLQAIKEEQQEIDELTVRENEIKFLKDQNANLVQRIEQLEKMLSTMHADH